MSRFLPSQQIRADDGLVLGSLAMTMGGVLLGAILRAPHAFGVTALLVIALLIGGWALTGSRRLAWLLPFGFVAGVLELWADWIHVEHFGSLVYTDYFGFRLLASPSYMAVGWWLTVVQFGYVALRLADRWRPWQAVATVTFLGMTIPPWYEEFAAPARAWHYTTAGPAVSNTPLWVILTYGGCTFSIATAALLLYRGGRWPHALAGGFFTGAGITLSGIIWFALLG
ncbi:MAG: hypothetical protein R3248_09195 [Candidatus Promineifilaceae bacterium]|nr:hypothetical protein [Candidatus Promineifilaceae bacterium]